MSLYWYCCPIEIGWYFDLAERIHAPEHDNGNIRMRGYELYKKGTIEIAQKLWQILINLM